MAFNAFARGHANVDIARKLQVSEETVGSYRREYEEKMQSFADANPDYLQRLLTHTLQALAETEQVHSEAWKKYSSKKTPDSLKPQYLKMASQAIDQKAKILGLTGVSQEYHANAQRISALQVKLLEFMSRELCATDRAKLEKYIRGIAPPAPLQIEAEVVNG